MKTEFIWNRPPAAIIKEKTKGDAGLLFLANEAKNLMDPYVPAQNLVLAQNTNVYVESSVGVVEYTSPYAHYQWAGEVYGPSYPIMENGSAAGWYSPGFKKPTGKKLNYSKFRHPMATSHWDQAMKAARMNDLLSAYQDYIAKE